MKRLFLPAFLAIAVMAPVYAVDDHHSFEKQCKISRRQAEDIALKKVAGTIVDTDAERDSHGHCYWSIEIKPKHGVTKEVEVDGDSGAVLSVKVDRD